MVGVPAVALVGGLWLFAVPGQAERQVTRVDPRLSWIHNRAYAGDAAADEQGHFADAGLAVGVIEGGRDHDPDIDQVHETEFLVALLPMNRDGPGPHLRRRPITGSGDALC